MAFGSTIGGWRGEGDPGTGPRALRPWSCAVALGLALCLHGVGPAQAGEDEGALGSSFLSDTSLDAGLDAEVETAFETDDASGQKFEVQVWPELVIDFPGGLSVTAMGRLRGDAFDELEPGSPAQDTTAPQTRRALIGDDVELELRELYAEKQLGDLHLTLGKQQVVWGQADGLKVLDIVNPQDFREFILDEFVDSRIPLWTFNAEVDMGDVTTQFLWLPDQTYNDIAEPGALFAFTAPQFTPALPPGAVGVVQRSPDRPSAFFQDSNVGVRLSAFVDGWDLTANYLYHYSNNPVFFQSLVPTPAGPVLVVTPEYRRSHLIGGTFSNAFGDFVIRGEAAFLTDRFSLTSLAVDPNGVTESNEISYVLGVDWYGLDDVLLSGQMFQSILTDAGSGLIRDHVETSFTLLARHSFLDDELEADVIWLTSLNKADGLIRLELTYDLWDGLEVWAGGDIFYGASDGFFGQFNDRDRVVTGLKWHW